MRSGESRRGCTFFKLVAAKHSAIMEETVQMSATESDVMRLTWRTGDGVEVQVITFIGNEGRGYRCRPTRRRRVGG